MKVLMIPYGEIENNELTKQGKRQMNRLAKYIELHPYSYRIKRIYAGTMPHHRYIANKLNDFVDESPLHQEGWNDGARPLADQYKDVKALMKRAESLQEVFILITSPDLIAYTYKEMRSTKDQEAIVSPQPGDIFILEPVGSQWIIHYTNYLKYKELHKLLSHQIVEYRVITSILIGFAVSLMVYLFGYKSLIGLLPALIVTIPMFTYVFLGKFVLHKAVEIGLNILVVVGVLLGSTWIIEYAIQNF